MVAAGMAGLGLGFLVAAQVGPIWLLCARTALRNGLAPALAVGLGAACVDFLYACLGVAGAAGLLHITGLRVGLGLVGAGVLLLLGARTLLSALWIRAGAETDDEVASPWAALRTSAIATASNPLTVASWAGDLRGCVDRPLHRATERHHGLAAQHPRGEPGLALRAVGGHAVARSPDQ